MCIETKIGFKNKVSGLLHKFLEVTETIESGRTAIKVALNFNKIKCLLRRLAGQRMFNRFNKRNVIEIQAIAVA